MRVACPKCKGISTLCTEQSTIVHKCLCGYYKAIGYYRNGEAYEYNDTNCIGGVPRKNTSFWECVVCLANIYPNSYSKQKILEVLFEEDRDVILQFNIMMFKGYIIQVSNDQYSLSTITYNLYKEIEV